MNIRRNIGPQSFKDILNNRAVPKTPTYEWQELALRVIKELRVPNFKRNSIFKVCKDNHRDVIINSLNDTKELCHSSEKWRYFLKLVSSPKQ